MGLESYERQPVCYSHYEIHFLRYTELLKVGKKQVTYIAITNKL